MAFLKVVTWKQGSPKAIFSVKKKQGYMVFHTTWKICKVFFAGKVKISRESITTKKISSNYGSKIFRIIFWDWMILKSWILFIGWMFLLCWMLFYRLNIFQVLNVFHIVNAFYRLNGFYMLNGFFRLNVFWVFLRCNVS